LSGAIGAALLAEPTAERLSPGRSSRSGKSEETRGSTRSHP
jgi:hypothetical protein